MPMFPTIRLGRQLSRGALAMALAAATTSLIASPALAKDKKPEAAPAAPQGPKITMSKAYQPKAVALSKALDAMRTKPEFTAARQRLIDAFNAVSSAPNSAARKAAIAQRDAVVAELRTIMAAEIAQMEGLKAAEAGPDDKYVTGQFTGQIGKWIYDLNFQRLGFETQLASGKALPADVPKFEEEAGSACYDLQDYACAQTHYAAAVAGGNRNGNVELILADTYFKRKLAAEGADILMKSISSRKAAGLPIGPEWYGTGLNAVFGAKLLPQSAAISQGMVRDYPTAANWSSAVRVLRYLGGYQNQEMLDLLRLMKRTGSFEEGNDYAEYVELGDKLRFPLEVLEVIDLGTKAGKLDATGDAFVRDAKTAATAHAAEDRAGMAGMETRAKSAAATPAVINAVADVMLSYGQPAKAEEYYNLALTKTGLDKDRLNTRLGIAQLDQGKFAEAQATFAKVTGSRQLMAQLWSIYAAQKAKVG